VSAASIFVYGAGGHGKVVADILLASGVTPTGFIDDDPARDCGTVLGLPVYTGEWLERSSKSESITVVLGIGDNSARRSVMERCLGLPVQVCTAIHPKATVASSARIGQGTVVMAGAVINPDAQVGDGVIVNSGAIIEHDNVIGPFAHLSPNAATGGAVHVGALTHVGLGAVILPGINVGDATVIGAGSVVVRDIPGHVIAMGVPARVIAAKQGYSRSMSKHSAIHTG
jgi:sugar O-acyltransferase (sialic acid O-acetyltransferase NeuD family)